MAFRDRPIHERIAKFNHSIREGNVELVSITDHTYEEQYFMKCYDYSFSHYNYSFIIIVGIIEWVSICVSMGSSRK